MINEITKVYYSRIQSNRIINYSRLENYYPKKNRTSFTSENRTDNHVKGVMSRLAKKRIENVLFNWISTIQFYLLYTGKSQDSIKKFLRFVTLTLSAQQIHSDSEIKKKCLFPFLQLLRDRYGVKNYIWKAEKQKNGNIHFHLILDKYISNRNLQMYWNRYQENLLYISRFEKRLHHRNPPSSEITSVRKLNRISWYLSKEMAKQQHQMKVDGKQWDCSNSLLQISAFTTIIDANYDSFLNEITKNKDVNVHFQPYFSIINMIPVKMFKELELAEYPELCEHYFKNMQILFYTKNQ